MSELFFDLVWGLFDIWTIILTLAWQISIIVLLVLLCRLLVSKVSKQASYILWAIVAIRLLVPAMPESGFSIFNIADSEFWGVSTTVSENITVPEVPLQENAGTVWENPVEVTPGHIPMTGTNIEPIITNIATEPENSLLTDWMFVAWLIGMAVMGWYGVISYCVLKHKLRFATTCDRKVYEAENISSPFVFGIIKPRIYLPYRLSDEERDYILHHENYHIRRKDYLVKILAFALLTIYWFHPLVWAAYYLMSRDMELSCDEQVLKEMGVTERKAYSTLLLSFASQKRFPLPSPVSFGENDIKSRIKSILNYKKPTFWSLMAMTLLIVALVAGCLTDAKDDNSINNSASKTEMTDDAISELAETLYATQSPYIGDVVTNGKILKVLFETLGLEKGRGGMELQTRMEPYWISISFLEMPDANKMWQASAMYLALVGNANEVRWNYEDENGNLVTYYVTVDSIRENLNGLDVKEYAESEEKIAELWKLLDKKRTEMTTGVSSLVLSTTWDKYAMDVGMDFTERIEWENRLITDDINYRGEEGSIEYCFYQDFDLNGIKDLILYGKNEFTENCALYIYMNDNPLYTHVLPLYCWDMQILSGDIDHDGKIEIIYSGYNGGNGGVGGYVKGILKYKEGTFTEMKLPGDFTGEELEFGEAGYHINVFFGKDTGTYEVICPAIEEFERIYAEYTKSENGEYIVKPQYGAVAGTNCRGFYNLKIITEKGMNYLMAEEYLYKEGGVNDSLGNARFIFDWSDKTGWFVKDFEVYSFAHVNSDEESTFEAMKAELEFYPSNYYELKKNWSNIPIINESDGSIYDPNNRLTEFAYLSSRNMTSGSLIFARFNEELTYVYVNYKDGKYYYLEDDYQKVYTNALHSATKYSDGSIYESFYLTNEENVTENDIFESMLSSQFPSPLDFVFVYMKKLD